MVESRSSSRARFDTRSTWYAVGASPAGRDPRVIVHTTGRRRPCHVMMVDLDEEAVVRDAEVRMDHLTGRQDEPVFADERRKPPATHRPFEPKLMIGTHRTWLSLPANANTADRRVLPQRPLPHRRCR